MSSALIIGDIHLSDKPPSIRTETYTEDILAKLKFAVTQAKNHNVDVIVLAGDVFHIKTPSRTSHGLVQVTADVLGSAGLPVRIVPGNHDMSHDRLDSLSQQPLGSLVLAPNIKLLIGAELDFPWLFGLPWLADWDSDLPKWVTRFNASGAQLMVTHAPLFPPGKEPPYEFIAAEDWAKISVPASVYYGHIHESHGIYHAGDVIFCNHGAVSRGSLHEESLKRQPQVTLWSTEEGFSPIQVPCKQAKEVFLLDEHQEHVTEAARLDEFLEAVGNTSLKSLSVEGVRAEIQAMDISPATKKIIDECLDLASE